MYKRIMIYHKGRLPKEAKNRDKLGEWDINSGSVSWCGANVLTYNSLECTDQITNVNGCINSEEGPMAWYDASRQQLWKDNGDTGSLLLLKPGDFDMRDRTTGLTGNAYNYNNFQNKYTYVRGLPPTYAVGTVSTLSGGCTFSSAITSRNNIYVMKRESGQPVVGWTYRQSDPIGDWNQMTVKYEDSNRIWINVYKVTGANLKIGDLFTASNNFFSRTYMGTSSGGWDVINIENNMSATNPTMSGEVNGIKISLFTQSDKGGVSTGNPNPSGYEYALIGPTPSVQQSAVLFWNPFGASMSIAESIHRDNNGISETSRRAIENNYLKPKWKLSF